MEGSLAGLLGRYREIAQSEREKGGYFEELIICYLKNEPRYRDLYAGKVWSYAEWAKKHNLSGRDDAMSSARRRSGMALLTSTSSYVTRRIGPRGVVFEGEDESAFQMVHDETTIRGAKRLYMTSDASHLRGQCEGHGRAG